MKMIWVLNEIGQAVPNGIFSSLRKGHDVVLTFKSSGMLTAYPLDLCVYDWVIGKGLFHPKEPRQTTPKFIQSFTSAYQEHYHFDCEDGQLREIDRLSEEELSKSTDFSGVLPEVLWVFNGKGARFPCGVFSSLETLECWTQQYSTIGDIRSFRLNSYSKGKGIKLSDSYKE